MACAICGSNNDLQDHHLAPRVLNGQNDLTISLCFYCHRSVHGLDTSKMSHSDLTKEGLKRAKINGKLLGWSNPNRKNEQEIAALRGAQTRKGMADKHAANVLPLIATIQARGATLRQIATELNERGIKTARGGQWHAMTVRNVLTRIIPPV